MKKGLGFSMMLILLAGFLLLGGCGGDGGGDPPLSGDITISPNSGVETGTELTASYSGSESVIYQWKKGSAAVGVNSTTYTPNEAGSYTVTVSAAGYQSKTSPAVTVTVRKTPEEKPAAERWKTWISSNRPAQVTNTVDSDGVCTITIGYSSVVVNPWDGASQYDYTAKAGSKYRYVFEAWTTNPSSRNLDIQYYYNGSSATHTLKLDITTERKTYTINGNVIPASGVSQVEFRDATTVGTFKIKIISITEY